MLDGAKNFTIPERKPPLSHNITGPARPETNPNHRCHTNDKQTINPRHQEGPATPLRFGCPCLSRYGFRL
jgi:hypothetical protein